jgi:hypothetical protein
MEESAAEEETKLLYLRRRVPKVEVVDEVGAAVLTKAATRFCLSLVGDNSVGGSRFAGEVSRLLQTPISAHCLQAFGLLFVCACLAFGRIGELL